MPRQSPRDKLIADIAHMIGANTYNHAPINYQIAEIAVRMVEDSYYRLHIRRRIRGEAPDA